MKRLAVATLALVLLISSGSWAWAQDQSLQDSPATVTLVWPQDCTAINYDDLHSIADYLLVLAWYHVEDAKAYLLSMLFDKGGGEFGEWDGIVSLQYVVLWEGLAILPFLLDEATWNALASYVITWQVRALSDPTDPTSVIAVSPKFAFTMNPVVR